MKKKLRDILIKRRKIITIAMAIMLTFVLYQFFWGSDSSPLKSYQENKAQRQEQLADGIWGQLGFSANSEDNIITYILLGVLVVTTGVRAYQYYAKKPKSNSNCK